jgi:hypothetical protein
LLNTQPSAYGFTNIFLVASIVFLTVGSGCLARAGMHYSDAMADDARGNPYYCDGCSDSSSSSSNEQIVSAYVGSIQGKMQSGLQNMIHHAGVGAALFSMGTGFSMVYFKWFRNA